MIDINLGTKAKLANPTRTAYSHGLSNFEILFIFGENV